MGEIKKQGISNSIIIIIGAVIGAVNVMFLFPKILPEAYFGLTRVLFELTYIFLQFGLVGANGAIVRFWSRAPDGSQLFRYVLKHSIIATIVVFILLAFFKEAIIHFYIDKSALIGEHFNTIYVLFIAALIFEFFSAASAGMLRTQLPTFLREVFIRVYVMMLLISYYFKLIGESTFVNLFIVGYVLIGIIILFYVLKHKNVLKQSQVSLSSDSKKSINKFRVAGFFNGFSGSIVNRLDIIMIAGLVVSDVAGNNGLKSVAIYSIALYASTLIEIPSRGVFAISYPIVSKFWVSNEIDKIKSVYKKSSINLFIVALLLFLLLSLNIDNLLLFLKESFLAAKPVILILGVSKVFNMLLGLNNIILSTSKHYLIGTYTMVGLIGLTFSLNYWLIPVYGITGAAVGSFISIVVYNLTTYFFLWYKFNIQPFSLNTLKVFIIGAIAYYITSFLVIDNIYLSILSKTIVFSILYLVPVYFFKASSDINEVVDKVFIRFFKRSN